jgi:transposase-like protein
MNQLYDVVGISKQAVHQYENRQRLFNMKVEQLMLEADEVRKAHPGCGVEKMYHILQPDFIGRDRFVETFMGLGYRLKRRKNYKRTTIASKLFYPNLIKGLKVKSPSHVWQSDITYLRVQDRYYYAVFIIDVYTRKIVGYQVSDHMRATANVKALQMALKQHQAPKIHHSDRGSQYTYGVYTEILKKAGTELSMGLIAQENAYAERFHKTLKYEYLKYWKPKTLGVLKRCVKRAVENYNEKRIHDNLDKQTPVTFERMVSRMKSDQRPILEIFNDKLIQKPVNSI